MRSQFVHTILLLLIMGITSISNAQLQRKPNTPTPKTRILFLVDGSGSMLGTWENELRINVAKRVLSELVDSLSTIKNVELGLRVYGHQYNKKYKNCKDTRLEVSFYPKNSEKIKSTLSDIRPQGVTPIAYSLEQAANDFNSKKNVRNVIIIITDGLESCDGDPCKVSKALQSKHIFLRPFVVGIDMPLRYESQFSCLGKFKNAKTSSQLKGFLSEIIHQSMMDSWVRVDLLNDKGLAKETNVNMSFVNNATKVTEYDYVHQIMPDGRSSKLQIDPIPTYDLVVHTIPEVVKKNIQIEKEYTLIKVKTPQGGLYIGQGSMPEYKNLKAVLRKKDSHDVIHVLSEKKTEQLLVGSYDIEILSLPVIKKTIRIVAGKTIKIDIPSPGKMNVIENIPGYGTVYKINKDGSSTLIYNLNKTSPRTSIAMQPGKYKLVFRARTAKGSIHTSVDHFEIYSGKTTSVNLLSQ